MVSFSVYASLINEEKYLESLNDFELFFRAEDKLQWLKQDKLILDKEFLDKRALEKEFVDERALDNGSLDKGSSMTVDKHPSITLDHGPSMSVDEFASQDYKLTDLISSDKNKILSEMHAQYLHSIRYFDNFSNNKQEFKFAIRVF